MKRLSVLFTGKERLEVVEEDEPKLREGELLVKTVRTMISTGTESTVYRRNFAPGTHWDQWVKYPFRPGYLHVGTVAEVGKGATGWKVGDRVASRSGHSSLVVVDAESASRASSPEAGDCTPVNRAIRIPAEVSDDEAVWMGLGKIVQVGIRAAEHKLGDAVVVIGLGLLGQLVVQYTRLLGAAEVIAIDVSQKRLDMAARHGATTLLKMSAADALAAVKEVTGGHGADVVYDVTGHPAVLAAALPLARRFGSFILLGDPGAPNLQTLTPDVITRGVRIIGAHDGHPSQLPNPFVRWSALEMYELFLKYVSRRQMVLADLITNRFAPRDAEQAYTLLQTDRENAMGVVFDWK
jgi:2-desacetyl-2-hydroxyethyl bacteriochlorophyllide A dehydrogenase